MASIQDNRVFEAFSTASEYVYIYVCDMKTDVSRWSLNAIEYFDLEGEYMEDAGEKWLQRIHPDDRKIYLDDITDVFSGRKDRHACQYRAMNRFGEYVWIECKGTIIKDEDGEPTIFAGLMTRLDNKNKYDSLTNLMTAHEFYKTNFTEEEGVILLLGIDDFRRVINSYGYSFGNNVLVEFSRRLTELCGTDDNGCNDSGEGDGGFGGENGGKVQVFRFHGDEFLITADGKNEEYIRELYERIKDMAANLGPLNGRQVSLAVSAGAVSYPKDGNSREDLVNNLEHSLEYAKQNDRGNLTFFTKEIWEKHKRSQVLLEELTESIRNGFEGFELYFQPLVVPGTRRIAGCESLLRWKGKNIKDSGPSEFISVMEQHGLICQVGDWVMEQALKQQKEWRETYGDIYVTFNVSYQQFLSEGFVDKLIQMSKEYEVEPNYIIVELTESCKVEAPEELAAMFDRLREAGFQIALDDFGTAYSSLELLKSLPADFIKIEHSFVRELAEQGHEIDMMIIENLLGLCRRLNYNAIVEGVENENVDDIVSRMDATYLQGYCYSKPVCKGDFEEMLENAK